MWFACISAETQLAMCGWNLDHTHRIPSNSFYQNNGVLKHRQGSHRKFSPGFRPLRTTQTSVSPWPPCMRILRHHEVYCSLILVKPQTIHVLIARRMIVSCLPAMHEAVSNNCRASVKMNVTHSFAEPHAIKIPAWHKLWYDLQFSARRALSTRDLPQLD